MAAQHKSTLQVLTDENAALTQQVAMWKARALALERVGDIKRNLVPFNQHRAAISARVDQVVTDVCKQLEVRPDKHLPTFTFKLDEKLVFDSSTEPVFAQELATVLAGTFACKVKFDYTTKDNGPDFNVWNKGRVNTIRLTFE